MKMSRILRIIQIIVNFFIRICSFRPDFIRNNEIFEGVFIQGVWMSFVDDSLPVEYENKEQMGKSLLNKLILRCTTMYFNPTRLWMGPFGFFVLEKGDPLCGVVEPSEELQSRLEEEAIRIRGMSSVCVLGGLMSMSGIKFLVPFICSTVKVYLKNHSANLRSWG
ncbi:hypothetical protein Peur_058779 [Populus x canadensis]